MCVFPLSAHSCPWAYSVPAAGMRKFAYQWNRIFFPIKKRWSEWHREGCTGGCCRKRNLKEVIWGLVQLNFIAQDCLVT